jgi:molybdenum cofactor cytidylyltransferase
MNFATLTRLPQAHILPAKNGIFLHVSKNGSTKIHKTRRSKSPRRGDEAVFPRLFWCSMLAAVILSAGVSSRMGSPKALVSYQGVPFLEHLLAATRHRAIGARRVVLGPHAPAITARVSLAEEEIVINQDWEKGQLSSVQAALRTLPAETEGMLLCPVDHPLISAELVGFLIEAFLSARAPVVLPVFAGRRGHPVIFSSAVFPELLQAPFETGARAVVWAHRGEVHEIPTSEEGCVLNLNDPNALLKLKTGAP